MLGKREEKRREEKRREERREESVCVDIKREKGESEFKREKGESEFLFGKCKQLRSGKEKEKKSVLSTLEELMGLWRALLPERFAEIYMALGAYITGLLIFCGKTS